MQVRASYTGVTSLLYSRLFSRHLLKSPFDVPSKIRQIPLMDTEGRQRAAEALSLLTNGMEAVELARVAGIPDPATVRDFLGGLSWPRSTTRGKLEDAAGMERGDLALYARGSKRIEVADGDPVVAAIKGSGLSPSNKRRLELTYLDMLDAQGEVGTG